MFFSFSKLGNGLRVKARNCEMRSRTDAPRYSGGSSPHTAVLYDYLPSCSRAIRIGALEI
jgi:hypothetical protein